MLNSPRVAGYLQEPSSSYILQLRAALDANGWQHTKLIHLDSSWDEGVFEQVMADSDVRAAVHALGLHAPPPASGRAVALDGVSALSQRAEAAPACE